VEGESPGGAKAQESIEFAGADGDIGGEQRTSVRSKTLKATLFVLA
jgi:hypothetical protein